MTGDFRVALHRAYVRLLAAAETLIPPDANAYSSFAYMPFDAWNDTGGRLWRGIPEEYRTWRALLAPGSLPDPLKALLEAVDPLARFRAAFLESEELLSGTDSAHHNVSLVRTSLSELRTGVWGHIYQAAEMEQRGGPNWREEDGVDDFWYEYVLVIHKIDVKSMSYIARSLETAWGALAASESLPLGSVPTLPIWNSDTLTLTYKSTIIRKFNRRCRPADTQREILDAFQEGQWPAQVRLDLDPKAILGAVGKLNKGQAPHLIEFCGNGDGDGVAWNVKSVGA